jgi:hypothetical protein
MSRSRLPTSVGGDTAVAASFCWRAIVPGALDVQENPHRKSW